MSRIGGIIFVKVNGQQYRAKGDWTYNLGQPMREFIVGSDSVHGYKEVPQVPFISGMITDTSELNMTNLLTIKGATVQLELPNDKIIILRDAAFEGEGSGNTGEGEIEVKFSGFSAEEA